MDEVNFIYISLFQINIWTELKLWQFSQFNNSTKPKNSFIWNQAGLPCLVLKTIPNHPCSCFFKILDPKHVSNLSCFIQILDPKHVSNLSWLFSGFGPKNVSNLSCFFSGFGSKKCGPHPLNSNHVPLRWNFHHRSHRKCGCLSGKWREVDIFSFLNACSIKWRYLPDVMREFKKHWVLVIWDSYFKGRMENCSARERDRKRRELHNNPHHEGIHRWYSCRLSCKP